MYALVFIFFMSVLVEKKKQFDLSFHYKNLLRSLVLYKSKEVDNTYALPKLQGLILSIDKSQWDNLDQRLVYQYFYLFSFVLGRRSFYSKVKSFFSLGEWYYNFSLQVIMWKENGWRSLRFFIYDWIPHILDNQSFQVGVYSKKSKIFFFRLGDFHRISEINRSFGVFYGENALNIRFYLKGASYSNSLLLMKNLKVPYN